MQRKQKVNKSLEVSDEVKHSFQHRSLFYSDVEYEAPFVFLTLDCRIQKKEKSVQVQSTYLFTEIKFQVQFSIFICKHWVHLLESKPRLIASKQF